MLGIFSPECGKVFSTAVSNSFTCRQVTENIFLPDVDGFLVITVSWNRDTSCKVAGECTVAQAFFDVAVGEGSGILTPFRMGVNQIGQFLFEL